MHEDKWLEYQKTLMGNIDYYKGWPIPSFIEFNLITQCTRRCTFCPVSHDDFFAQYNKHVFDIDVYKSIIIQLKHMHFHGVISYSGFCEPLLYPFLNEIVSFTRSILSDSFIIITTNGDLLTQTRKNELIESGVNIIGVSCYEKEKKEYFESLGKHIIVKRRWFDGSNYGFYFSNRTGVVGDKEHKTQLCYYPFYMMYFDVDGYVLPCVHDAYRKTIMGNVVNESVWDIWTGEKFTQLRKNLICRKRINSCEFCNVDGTLIGERYYEAWKEV